MSETNSTPSKPMPAGYQSTEEMVAAQSSHESDALSRAQAELAELQAKSAELADQFLRAKAEVDNARRRAEEEISKARKFAVESFAESLLPVADSLEAGLIIKDATSDQIRERRPGYAAPVARSIGTQQGDGHQSARQEQNSIRISTRPSVWCPRSTRPTRWSRCCKKAISLPTACCARHSSPSLRRSRHASKQAL